MLLELPALLQARQVSSVDCLKGVPYPRRHVQDSFELERRFRANGSRSLQDEVDMLCGDSGPSGKLRLAHAAFIEHLGRGSAVGRAMSRSGPASSRLICPAWSPSSSRGCPKGVSPSDSTASSCWSRRRIRFAQSGPYRLLRAASLLQSRASWAVWNWISILVLIVYLIGTGTFWYRSTQPTKQRSASPEGDTRTPRSQLPPARSGLASRPSFGGNCMSPGEAGTDTAPTPGEHGPRHEDSASRPDHGQITVQV